MNKKTIKNVLGSLLFFSIILFIFCKLTWVFRSNNETAREDICGFHNQGHVDVVFCGASNTIKYYQPLEAWKKDGYTSYIYGTTGGMVDMLKNYIADCRKYNDAELYVVDLRAITLLSPEISEGWIRVYTDSLPVFSSDRWAAVTSSLFSRNWREAESIPSYYFDIMKYHKHLEALESEYQWKYWNTDTIYNVGKGFGPKEFHVPFDRPKENRKIGTLNEQQLRVLNELLDYCDKENVPVLFVASPYIIPDDEWELLNAVDELITERGYEFINFNYYYDELGLDFETDFGDINHVNFLGAEKYTDYMMDYLTSNYDLPDHRDDPAYQQWDADYDAYAETMEYWREEIVTLVDSHLQAKEDGQRLKTVNDFSEWFSVLRSSASNFTTVILMDKIPKGISDNNPFNQLMGEYGIDTGKNRYIGVWNGADPVAEVYDEGELETEIGISFGLGRSKCSVSIPDARMSINDINYYSSHSGVQIIVYDNNYVSVIDSVRVDIDGDKSILNR